MMAKPMKTLELHYPMIQFLIIDNIIWYLQVGKREEAIHKLKIEKLALQEQQQKAEDNVSVQLFLTCTPLWSIASFSFKC